PCPASPPQPCPASASRPPASRCAARMIERPLTQCKATGSCYYSLTLLRTAATTEDGASRPIDDEEGHRCPLSPIGSTDRPSPRAPTPASAISRTPPPASSAARWRSVRRRPWNRRSPPP